MLRSSSPSRRLGKMSHRSFPACCTGSQFTAPSKVPDARTDSGKRRGLKSNLRTRWKIYLINQSRRVRQSSLALKTHNSGRPTKSRNLMSQHGAKTMTRAPAKRCYSTTHTHKHELQRASDGDSCHTSPLANLPVPIQAAVARRLAGVGL